MTNPSFRGAAKGAAGTNRVLLGAVTDAHGIAGEVRVKTFTEAPENLEAYGALTTGDGRQLTLLSLRPTKGDGAIARFEGISDRNAAGSLKGQALYVMRDALPEPEEGAYYYADLIGLTAEDAAGAELGAVVAVHNFGAGDVIALELKDGVSEFVPFTDTAVPIVDLAGGRIVVELTRATEDH